MSTPFATLHRAIAVLLLPVVRVATLVGLAAGYGLSAAWRRFRNGRIKFDGAGQAWVMPNHLPVPNQGPVK